MKSSELSNPTLTYADKLLMKAIKEIFNQAKIEGEQLNIQYVDFKKDYPNVCNITVLSMPGKMVIAYYEDVGGAE